jgi:hypothetical protein
MNDAKATFGPMHAVPCPWCKKALDFTEVEDQLTGGGFGGSTAASAMKDGGLSSKETPKVACDYCNRDSAITGVFRDPVITVEANGKRAAFFVTNVKCFFCEKHNNMKDAYTQSIGYSGVYDALGDDERIGNPLIGASVGCDHCKRDSKIVNVTTKPHIRLAPA